MSMSRRKALGISGSTLAGLSLAKLTSESGEEGDGSLRVRGLQRDDVALGAELPLDADLSVLDVLPSEGECFRDAQAAVRECRCDRAEHGRHLRAARMNCLHARND